MADDGAALGMDSESDAHTDILPVPRVESTYYLRQKLGFHDDARWKQLSTRRLEFIHSLGLNLKRASEQESKIKAVASQLCAEYNYGSEYLPDFEKLVRVGVQSVRRNQRRPTKARAEVKQSISANSARHVVSPLGLTPSSYPAHTPPRLTSPTDIDGLRLHLREPLRDLSAHVHEGLHSIDDAAAALLGSGLVRWVLGQAVLADTAVAQHAQVVAKWIENGAVGTALAKISHPSMTSFVHVIGVLCARDWKKATGLLEPICKVLLVMTDMADEQVASILEAAATPTQPKPDVHPSFGRLPAIHLPPNGSNGPKPVHLPNLVNQLPSDVLGLPAMAPLSPHHGVPHPGVHPPFYQAGAPLGPPPVWELCQVKLQFGPRVLEFTYSPRNNTPPTLGELIENGRAAFGVSPEFMLRIRNVVRGTTVETDSELADALHAPRAELEILLPPPRVPHQDKSDRPRFSAVAPEFHKP